MRLNAPKFVVFLATLGAAAAAVAVQYLGADIPYVGQHAFPVLLGAYGLLALGTLVRGL